MLKLLESHVKTILKFFNKAVFLKIVTKKEPKNAQKVIFGKNHVFFYFFGQYFQKYCPIQTFEKNRS